MPENQIDETVAWNLIGWHNPNPEPFIDANGNEVSERKVVFSQGYYIGRTYFDETLGTEFPYSRESQEYFGNEEEAEAALAENRFTFRLHP